MLCVKCGKKIVGDGRYCPNCGAEVEVEERAPFPVPEEKDIEADPSNFKEMVNVAKEAHSEFKKMGFKHKFIFIGCAIAAVIPAIFMIAVGSGALNNALAPLIGTGTNGANKSSYADGHSNISVKDENGVRHEVVTDEHGNPVFNEDGTINTLDGYTSSVQEAEEDINTDVIEEASNDSSSPVGIPGVVTSSIYHNTDDDILSITDTGEGYAVGVITTSSGTQTSLDLYPAVGKVGVIDFSNSNDALYYTTDITGYIIIIGKYHPDYNDVYLQFEYTMDEEQIDPVAMDFVTNITKNNIYYEGYPDYGL